MTSDVLVPSIQTLISSGNTCTDADINHLGLFHHDKKMKTQSLPSCASPPALAVVSLVNLTHSSRCEVSHCSFHSPFRDDWWNWHFSLPAVIFKNFEITVDSHKSCDSSQLLCLPFKFPLILQNRSVTVESRKWASDLTNPETNHVSPAFTLIFFSRPGSCPGYLPHGMWLSDSLNWICDSSSFLTSTILTSSGQLFKRRALKLSPSDVSSGIVDAFGARIRQKWWMTVIRDSLVPCHPPHLYIV